LNPAVPTEVTGDPKAGNVGELNPKAGDPVAVGELNPAVPIDVTGNAKAGNDPVAVGVTMTDFTDVDPTDVTGLKPAVPTEVTGDLKAGNDPVAVGALNAAAPTEVTGDPNAGNDPVAVGVAMTDFTDVDPSELVGGSFPAPAVEIT